jgi:hypothetical protein
MKKISLIIIIFYAGYNGFSQQNDWASVEKIFGKKGTVQDDVFKISYPRSDLKVKVGDFTIAPGLALGSWIGFMSMDKGMNMQKDTTSKTQATMMGDLVLLDTEVPGVLKKLVSVNLKITAIHNHLINESPNVKYVHFSGSGDKLKLAEAILSVLSVTATPLTPPQSPVQAENVDWSKVEAILGTSGKHNGMLLQYSFPRKEKLKESGMDMPAFMGMATAVNFQKDGDSAAITGDFVLLADEVNPVIKILIENGITPTALHNHMIHDEPRLFMMHFWAIDDPEKLAKALQQVLTKANHSAIKK